MKGSERNMKCPCGSGKKWKQCCKDLKTFQMHKNTSASNIPEADLKKVLEYFNKIETDREVLKKIGICRDYHGSIVRTRDGYIIPMGNGIFRIDSNEALSFYDIIGIIAMDTLGGDWAKEEGEKTAENRSEIYKIISLLGATDKFEKVISYTGKKIKALDVPESGFSKNFLTLAFDIFCLRRHGSLPEQLIKKLKQFDQYQGARYEILVGAILCRLGYDLEWLDDRKAKDKHPEFIARKDEKEIYVEAKSRHIDGVHNKKGIFNETKAFKSTGWGGLINKALQKQVPPKIPFIIFVDMNAVNDGKVLPNWVKDIRKTLKQHLKKYSGKEAPFTSIVFTNYSYHYQGLDHAGKGVCFAYENDLTGRPYNSLNEKVDIMNALSHYGLIPDYRIPAPRTILHVSSEQPDINNMPDILRKIR